MTVITNITKEDEMQKKIRCIHCGHEITILERTTIAQACMCNKVCVNNGVILEGAQGVDWVDISPQLLNG
jgi:DNA-directed RNA polymerase subunit RPC12/RpoP